MGWGLLDWLQHYNGAVLAALTCVYVAATIILVRLSQRSVDEIRITRMEQSRPYVMPSFEERADGLLVLVLRNYGMSIAYSIAVQVPQALVKAPSSVFEEDWRIALAKGTLSLAPGQSIMFALGGPAQYSELESLGAVPISTSYRGPNGTYHDSMGVDFGAFKGALVDQQSMAGVLWKIHEDLEDIAKSNRRV